jgi:glutathione reductase (NADPH)
MIKRAEEFGASTPNASLDWSKVVGRMNKIVNKFAGGKKPYLQDLGVDLIMGEARFTSPDSIRVGDKEYTAKRFLIGTGSVPSLPPIEGIEHALTSENMFHIKELPKSLVVIGGGYIGLEFVHVFANAGVQVTILQRGDRLLKSGDRSLPK